MSGQSVLLTKAKSKRDRAQEIRQVVSLLLQPHDRDWTLWQPQVLGREAERLEAEARSHWQSAAMSAATAQGADVATVGD
jgi:hypothetical protein